MLRTVISRSNSLLGVSRRLSALSAHQNPSTTTSVILSRLPSSIVQTKLQEGVAEVNSRKVELEPGCSLHFANETEARVAAETIRSKYNLETIVSQATMPCVSLQNIPDRVSADLLQKNFSTLNPRVIRMSGAGTLQIALRNNADAWKAMTMIRAMDIDGSKLKAISTRVNALKHVVSIHNVPSGSKVEDVEATIRSALEKQGIELHPEHEINAKQLFKSNRSTVTLRYDRQSGASKRELLAALNESQEGAYKVRKISTLLKPAVFLRNISHLEDQTLDTLLKAHRAQIERVQVLCPSEAKLANMAVAYFNSEESALECVAKLHGSIVDGRRVTANYREVGEPAVLVANIPRSTTLEDLQTYSGRLDHVRIEYEPGETEALVIVASPRQANIARQYYHNMPFGSRVLEAYDCEAHDTALIVSGRTSDAVVTPERVREALKGLTAQPKSISFESKSRAEVGFLTVDEAHKALEKFVKGGVKLSAGEESGSVGGSKVASVLSTLPTYVLQVLGLPVDTPVQKVTEDLATSLPEVNVLLADRSALLKFRRHQDVVPGMKKLKELQLDGQNIKVDRYRPLQQGGSTAYDVVTGAKLAAQVEIERFTLSAVIRDFMHLDPASRYQIAKNAFNRALFDARARKDMSTLFDSSMSKQAQEEAKMLFNRQGKAAGMDEADVNQRLFQLFVQKEEMMRYSKDFKTMNTLLGHAEESDAFNWSQFNVQDSEDMSRVLDEMHRADEEAADEMMYLARKGRRKAKLAAAAQHISADEDAVEEEIEKEVEEEKEGDELVEEGSDEEEADLEEYGSGTDVDSSDEEDGLTSDCESDSEEEDDLEVASDSEDELIDSDSEVDSSDLDSDSDSDSDFSSSDSDSDSDSESDGESPDRPMSDLEDPGFDHSDEDGAPKKRDVNIGSFRDEQGNELNLISTADGDMMDTSGNSWSMIVLNTDTTQKTLPGGRTVTHRALVMMGNLKGSGGFGMGKGKTPADALTAACRNSIRNLLHIDLYDNFGVAHDLYGKHNSCHCYIRATPIGREMVASAFAGEVLNRFGISSATVKMIGNRNPYSQINAIFNALSHHENIDEFAKDRGQRYLSLRWAYDKGI